MDITPEKQLTPVVSSDAEAHKSLIDPDALKLAEMGEQTPIF
jgi:hypothetical protein